MARRSTTLLIATMILGSAAIALPTGAAATDTALPGVSGQQQLATYAYDLPTCDAAAFASVQALLGTYESEPWIYTLKGVAGPMVSFDYAGKTWLAGLVCQPHDCGDNQLAFMTATGGSAGVAMLKAGGRTTSLGDPDSGQASILQALLAGN